MGNDTKIRPLDVGKVFLDKAQELSKGGITNLHLNKLIYLAHGYHFGNLEKPLITNGELAEAWKHGPVYRSVYVRYAPFNDRIIDSNFYNIGLPYKKLSNEIMQLLNKIWEEYKNTKVWTIVDMLHEKNSPWYIIWHYSGGKKGPAQHIPDELTEAYYIKIVKKLKEAENG